jgi:hypothetical protein
MPETMSGQIEYLCQLLDFPRTMFLSHGNKPALADSVVLEILTGIVLYHHLPRQDQGRVMRLIHANLEGRPAIAKAITKITDPMVNPMWGLWTKTTRELEADLAFAESVSTYLGLAGASFSVPSLYNMAKTNRTQAKGVGRGHPVLTVMIWGFYFNHDAGRQAIQAELVRRARSH